jgi:hypothetical protein
MRKLSIGKKNEISGEDYLTLLRDLAKGNYEFAEAIHNYHVSGFADWKNTFRMTDAWNNDIAIALTDQIDDDKLSKEFKLLKKNWQEIQKVDSQISKWLSGYVGLSSIDAKKDKLKLERKLKKIIVNGHGGRVQGPVWISAPAYQKLISKSKVCLLNIKKSEENISQRIDKLLRWARV